MAEKSPRKEFRLSAIAKGLAVDVFNMTRKHIDDKARRLRDRIQDETLNILLCINRANESRDLTERTRQQEAAKAAAINLAHLLGVAQAMGGISLTSCNYLSSRALGLRAQIATWMNSDKPR